VREEVSFKEEMKAELKESSLLLSSPEKTPEGEPTSSPTMRVLANRPRPTPSELDNPPAASKRPGATRTHRAALEEEAGGVN
jgi:hypothetical protein